MEESYHLSMNRRENQNQYFDSDINENKCFVGGFTSNTPIKEIKKYVNSIMKAKKITFPRNKKTKKMKGFCVVEFASKEEQKKFLDFKDHKFAGMSLTVNQFVSFQESAEIRKEIQERKLFLGDLPSTTTRTKIYEHFSHYGEVEDIRLQYKTKKNKPIFRRLGFLIMKNLRVIQSILNEKSHKIDGNFIIVEKAIVKSKKITKNGNTNSNNEIDSYSEVENIGHVNTSDTNFDTRNISNEKKLRFNISIDQKLLREFFNYPNLSMDYIEKLRVDPQFKNANGKILAYLPIASNICELRRMLSFKRESIRNMLIKEASKYEIMETLNSPEIHSYRKNTCSLFFKNGLIQRFTL